MNRIIGMNLVGIVVILAGAALVLYRDDIMQLLGAIMLVYGGGLWFADPGYYDGECCVRSRR